MLKYETPLIHAHDLIDNIQAKSHPTRAPCKECTNEIIGIIVSKPRSVVRNDDSQARLRDPLSCQYRGVFQADSLDSNQWMLLSLRLVMEATSICLEPRTEKSTESPFIALISLILCLRSRISALKIASLISAAADVFAGCRFLAN